MSSISQPMVVERGAMSLLRDYSELMKARVTTLIVMTAWCGYYFGAARSGVTSLSWTLLHALVGIAAVSGGTAGMNEVMERDLDALMRRTARRPLQRVHVSESGRFLVTEDGRPFFYLGDTAWELFHRLTREEAVRYLQVRADQGYTAIQAVTRTRAVWRERCRT